jgi:hypothetical protein
MSCQGEQMKLSQVLPIVVMSASGMAAAQDYPSKAVRIVVPFQAGGTTDVIARALAPPLSKALGQNVVVENRPGANTVIGAELVVRAPADGNALLFMAPSFTINPFVQAKLPFDPLKDFSGVTRLVYNPLIICVHLAAREVGQGVGRARARARANDVGDRQRGWRRAHRRRAFRRADQHDRRSFVSAPAVTSVLRADMLVGNMPIACRRIRQDAAVVNIGDTVETCRTSHHRGIGYPGFEAINWFGAVRRSGTPRNAIDRLSRFDVHSSSRGQRGAGQDRHGRLAHECGRF